MNGHVTSKIYRRPDVQTATGLGKTTLYNRIHDGLMVPPFSLGGLRSVGWLESEIQTIVSAMAAGKQGDDLRAIVEELIECRKGGKL